MYVFPTQRKKRRISSLSGQIPQRKKSSLRFSLADAEANLAVGEEVGVVGVVEEVAEVAEEDIAQGITIRITRILLRSLGRSEREVWNLMVVSVLVRGDKPSPLCKQ